MWVPLVPLIAAAPAPPANHTRTCTAIIMSATAQQELQQTQERLAVAQSEIEALRRQLSQVTQQPPQDVVSTVSSHDLSSSAAVDDDDGLPPAPVPEWVRDGTPGASSVSVGDSISFARSSVSATAVLRFTADDMPEWLQTAADALEGSGTLEAEAPASDDGGAPSAEVAASASASAAAAAAAAAKEAMAAAAKEAAPAAVKEAATATPTAPAMAIQAAAPSSSVRDASPAGNLLLATCYLLLATTC